MPGEIEQVAAAVGISPQELQDHLLRKAMDGAASAEPLPGPVRDAFTPCESVKCGPYDVRACFDGDIEYLSLLNHPLHEMRLRAQAEGGKVENLYQPQGASAWQLCYLLTHSLDDIDAMVEKGGLDAFKAAAKKQFSRLQLPALIKLSEACIEQYARYWQPVLSYGPDEMSGEDGEPIVKKNRPQAMGSGSS